MCTAKSSHILVAGKCLKRKVGENDHSDRSFVTLGIDVLQPYPEAFFGSSVQPPESQLHVSTPNQPGMNLATAVSQEFLVAI
jgi:hypothetical protein